MSKPLIKITVSGLGDQEAHLRAMVRIGRLFQGESKCKEVYYETERKEELEHASHSLNLNGSPDYSNYQVLIVDAANTMTDNDMNAFEKAKDPSNFLNTPS